MKIIINSNLDSYTQCESKLTSHRNCHTTGVEELRILTVQLLVGINQEGVGGLQLQAEVRDSEMANPLGGEVVRERDFLHSDEVTLGNTCRRVVVGIVSIA